MPEALSYEKTAKTAEINGQTLHYHDAGEGPALVLLHGAGPGVSGWSNFGGNISGYSQNFRTLVIDMPGFGGSGQPDEYPVSYLRYAADAVAGLLDELGIAKAHLLGNSLGGSVVVRFLLTHPDRADRVVLMGPGSALSIGLFSARPSEGIRRLLEFGAAPSREKMESFLRTLVFDQSLVTEELIDDRYQVAINPATGGGLAAMQRANQKFHRDGELWREAEQIKHEVLITWGREDRVQPLDGAFVGFRLLDNARLYVFPKCGHWAMIEKREEFERVTTSFYQAG